MIPKELQNLKGYEWIIRKFINHEGEYRKTVYEFDIWRRYNTNDGKTVRAYSFGKLEIKINKLLKKL